MNRFVTWAIPLAVLACAFVGAGQQKKNGAAPSTLAAAEPAPQSPYTEAIRDNNLGMALMDRADFENALGKFQMACIFDPQSDAGCVNMGIALLNLQRYEQARTILMKSAERNPGDPAAWFNLGILERIAGQAEAALQDFEKVRSLDPADADTAYLIGLVDSENGHDELAIPNFENAIQLDRFNASAELQAAQALERTGDTDGALEHLNRFQHLLSGNLGHSVTSTYGQQGKYSLAEELSVPPAAAPRTNAVHFVDVTAASGLSALFKEATGRAARPVRGIKAPSGANAEPARESLADFLGSGACVFDFDGDQKPGIFLVNGDGKGNASLYRNAGNGKFVNVTKPSGLIIHGQGTGCATGDFDNDGRPDLAVSSSEGVRLYQNQGNGKFKDVTAAAGIRADGLALGLTFVDFDRDGYLDLYVTRFNDFPLGDPARPFAFPNDAPAPGNMLWRNTGHGTFVDATSDSGVRGMTASAGMIASDVNNDGAIDFLVTGLGDTPLVLLNRREGPLEAMNPWTGPTPGPTAGAVALDFDKDGWMDYAFTHWSNSGISLWRNVRGTSFQKVALPNPGWMRGWGIYALDYDNDGWVDLLAAGETFAGEGRLLLLRNEGGAGFRDVTHETGLDKIKFHDPRSVIAADLDGEGAVDLLVTQNRAAPILLKNIGADKNQWIELGFKGVANRPAAGAAVTIFAGDQRQKWEAPGSSGYLGGAAEIHGGLGPYGQADAIRVVWPDGKLRTEMQVRAGKKIVISEAETASGPAAAAKAREETP